MMDNNLVWSALMVLAYIATLGPQSSSGEPLLVWSQRSHKWTRIRGIEGNPSNWLQSSQRRFVSTDPEFESNWYALAYDPASHYLYWHDRVKKTIYRQTFNDSFIEKRIDKVEKVYEGVSANITDMAIDWKTGSLYWADNVYRQIGVTASDKSSTDVARILYKSSSIEPVGIAIDHQEGLIYFADKANSKIWSMRPSGTGINEVATDWNGVREPHSLTFDQYQRALYWVQRNEYGRPQVVKLDLNQPDLYVTNVKEITDFHIGIAVSRDHIFLTNRQQFQLDIINKNNPNQMLYHIIDSVPNQISIFEIPQTPAQECVELKCEHFCVRENAHSYTCMCGDGYYTTLDGRSCLDTGDGPLYIFSTGEDLWSARTSIQDYTPHYYDLSLGITIKDQKRVQALAFHYELDYLYYNDIDTDILHASYHTGEWRREITVNTRQVEGMSVDWISKTLFWADNYLGHIMCSQLDGRFHRILITEMERPRGLTVDPIHGLLFWVDDNRNAIMQANMDGSGMQVAVSSVYNAQGITVDPIKSKLYWVEKNSREIYELTFGGAQKHRVFYSSSSLYDVTVYLDYATTTNPNDALQFAAIKSGQTMPYRNKNFLKDEERDILYSVPAIYDVILFDKYLQPDLPSSKCLINNGGCEQLCHPAKDGSELHHALGVTCQCAIGFTLNEDKKQCDSVMVYSDFLLFVDPYHKQIYQYGVHNVTAFGVQGMRLPRADFPISMDLDSATGRFFWVDQEQRAILAAKATDYEKGKEAELIWTIPTGALIERIRIDSIKEYLYYTDSKQGQIGRIGLDGYNHKIMMQGLSRPKGLEVDQVNGLVYWSELDGHVIMKMNSEGEESEVLYDDAVMTAPSAVTVVTTDTSKLYWADQGTGRIYYHELQDSSTELVFEDPYLEIIAIAADESNVYFSTWNEKGIYRLSINDSYDMSIVDESVFARLTDIRIFSGTAIPLITSTFSVITITSIAAAVFLFLLLLAICLICLACRKSKKDPEQSPPTSDAFIVPVTDPISADDHTYANDGASFPDLVQTTSLEPPSDLPAPPPLPPPPGQAPPGGYPKGVALPNPSGRRFKRRTPKPRPPPTEDPNFELTENHRQNTLIRRLVKGMRNPLASIRFAYDNREPETNVGQDQGSYIEPYQPQMKEPPNKSEYPPNLHRLPRGFAPASHSVPIGHVKQSWGRQKWNKMVGKK